jgi:hypothetical protein
MKEIKKSKASKFVMEAPENQWTEGTYIALMFLDVHAFL